MLLILAGPSKGSCVGRFIYLLALLMQWGKMGRLGVSCSTCSSQLQCSVELVFFRPTHTNDHGVPPSISALTRNDRSPAGELLPLPIRCKEKTALLT